MALDLKVPLLGDIMQEGTLVEWLRADGARVDKGEPLYRLETDKVTVDVEAPVAGTLRHLAAPPCHRPPASFYCRLKACAHSGQRSDDWEARLTEMLTTPAVYLPEWVMCAGCRTIAYGKRFRRDLLVCPECGRPERMSADDRIGAAVAAQYDRPRAQDSGYQIARP